MVELGEISSLEVSDFFWAAARSNSQDGGQTFVQPPIKGFLATALHFLALFSRYDDRLHG
jgi:hypothetical protein